MNTTSLALLGRLRLRSDHVSWSEFVDLYAPVLCRWNLTSGMQLADAQEVVQEVLLFVHERIDVFRHQRKGAFRAWLRQVTLNKKREFLRRRAAEQGTSGDAFDFDDLADPHAEAAWTAFYAEGLFERACEMVQPLVEDHTYRIFRRVYIDRQPPAAVASEFGVTRNMVYVAQCRCLTKVRGIIDRYLDDLP